MSKNEFLWKVEHGDDIVFSVKGKSYTILTWPDEGIVINEHDTNKRDVFSDAEDLVNHYVINNSPLIALLGDVAIKSMTQIV